MKARLIEATNGFNWGKFVVTVFDGDEWQRRPRSAGRALLAARGWSPGDVWVLDLETCEGAAFSPGGLPAADLKKHNIWVCPLYQPFLGWLYEWARDRPRPLPVDQLPVLVELPQGTPHSQSRLRRA